MPSDDEELVDDDDADFELLGFDKYALNPCPRWSSSVSI